MNFNETIYLAIIGAITAAVTWIANLLKNIYKKKESELTKLRKENTELKVELAKSNVLNLKNIAKSRKRPKDKKSSKE